MIEQPIKQENYSPYRIIRRLTPQPTGMGDVYLAQVRARYARRGRQVNLPGQVVLKASKPENILEDRLRKEADLLRRCRHPNVVRIFPDPRSTQQTPIYTASYTIDGAQRYQYAMEYVGKHSAAQLLEQKGRLGVQETLQIGIDIARALEHIHAQQMLNLDIKPSNIVLRQQKFGRCLLGRRAQAVLCDFGTARLFSDRAHNYGTDGFASPEQAQENAGQVSRVDQRSDLFSLGATLYTLLNGEPPCPQSTLYAVHTIEPLSQRNGKVSEKLAAVIGKALAVDPKQRYQTATELRHALERHVRVGQVQKCQILALLVNSFILFCLIGWMQLPAKVAVADFSSLWPLWVIPAPRKPASTVYPVAKQPTVTASPVPTTPLPTNAPTLAEATSTRIPTMTPGETPTTTPTANTPTASPLTPVATVIVVRTATATAEPPTLRSPKPGDFVDGQVTVQWHWTGKLGPNQAFEIQLWHDQDSIHYGAVDAKLTTPEQTRTGDNEYEYVLNFKTAYSVRQHGGADYNLAIAIVQLEPYQFIGPASVPIHVQVAN